MWTSLVIIFKEVAVDVIAAWIKKRWMQGKKKTKTIITNIKSK